MHYPCEGINFELMLFQHAYLEPFRLQIPYVMITVWCSFGDHCEIWAVSMWEWSRACRQDGFRGAGTPRPLKVLKGVGAPRSHHSIRRFKCVSSRTPGSPAFPSPANTPSSRPLSWKHIQRLSNSLQPTQSLWTWDKTASTWLPCVSPSCSLALFFF